MAGRYEGVPAHHCERCTGTLLRQRDLTKVLERLTPDLLEHVVGDIPIPPVPDAHPHIRCPDCGADMERYGYMGSHRVMIDGCQACNALWIDALELAAMAKMSVRLDKNMERFRLSDRPTDIVTAHMMTEAVSGAFLLGFVLG